jgi:hypothetical protein
MWAQRGTGRTTSGESADAGSSPERPRRDRGSGRHGTRPHARRSASVSAPAATFMTTEFWLTLLTAAVLVIAGYVSDTFSNDLAWALFAGVVAAYVVSRGIAKAGSKEGPFILGRDAER